MKSEIALIFPLLWRDRKSGSFYENWQEKNYWKLTEKEKNCVFIFVCDTKQMMLMWFELIVYVGCFSSIVLNSQLSRWCRKKTQFNRQSTVSDFNQLKFNAISFVCLNLKMKMKMQFYDNELWGFLCPTSSYTFFKFTTPYEFCHSSIVLVGYEFMQVLEGFHRICEYITTLEWATSNSILLHLQRNYFILYFNHKWIKWTENSLLDHGYDELFIGLLNHGTLSCSMAIIKSI